MDPRCDWSCPEGGGRTWERKVREIKARLRRRVVEGALHARAGRVA